MKQLFQAGPGWDSLASPWGTTESLIGSINSWRCYQKPGCFVKYQGGLGTIILVTYLSPFPEPQDMTGRSRLGKAKSGVIWLIHCQVKTSEPCEFPWFLLAADVFWGSNTWNGTEIPAPRAGFFPSGTNDCLQKRMISFSSSLPHSKMFCTPTSPGVSAWVKQVGRSLCPGCPQPGPVVCNSKRSQGSRGGTFQEGEFTLCRSLKGLRMLHVLWFMEVFFFLSCFLPQHRVYPWPGKCEVVWRCWAEHAAHVSVRKRWIRAQVAGAESWASRAKTLLLCSSILAVPTAAVASFWQGFLRKVLQSKHWNVAPPEPLS